MPQLPSSNELASLREDIRSEVATELRQKIEVEYARIQEEINKGKLYRAEQHAGYMRNWLAILTATVSVVLVGFGILGYTRTSDIEAYRKQITADATDVKALSIQVQENAKTVTDSMDSIKSYKQRVVDLDSKMKDTDARITNSDKNIAGIEKRSQQAERDIVATVTRISAVAQQTHHDLQSTISSVLLGDIPAISSATLVQGPALSSIQGTNFGNSPGHIFVDVQRTNPASLVPTRIEIQPPFKKWTDSKIDFELSPAEYQKIKDARINQASASSVLGLSGNVSVNLLEGLTFSPYLLGPVNTSARLRR